MRKLEVRAFFRKQRQPRGYVGYHEVKVQQLGYRTSLGFKVIEEEIVPNDVWIDQGCLGSYLGPWRSKFANWIPKAQGGHAEDFA